MTKKIKKINRQHAAIFSIILGSVLLTIATLGLVDYFRTVEGETIPSVDIVTTINTHPSENKPEVVSEDYTVPASQPRVIQIPALNVEGYIQRVGVNELGEMATPSNVHYAGWYVKSVTPGDSGLSIINGHAGGRYTEGLFKKLSQLTQGDMIKVQMGDLSWREFKVNTVATYPLEEVTNHLFDHDVSQGNELKLITCDGVFDDRTQTYSKRTLVSAFSVDIRY